MLSAFTLLLKTNDGTQEKFQKTAQPLSSLGAYEILWLSWTWWKNLWKGKQPAFAVSANLSIACLLLKSQHSWQSMFQTMNKKWENLDKYTQLQIIIIALGVDGSELLNPPTCASLALQKTCSVRPSRGTKGQRALMHASQASWWQVQVVCCSGEKRGRLKCKPLIPLLHT